MKFDFDSLLQPSTKEIQNAYRKARTIIEQLDRHKLKWTARTLLLLKIEPQERLRLGMIRGRSRKTFVKEKHQLGPLEAALLVLQKTQEKK
ncbi:MAG: hypothetical protein HY541_01240 [Deltaproteobacteria bacterium]|nr:hypothetical protein [Deltaproteobacteria bacterium]